MTISNLDEAKMMLRERSPVFLFTAGFIFFLCTVIAFWNGIVDYQTQIEQRSWIVTNATISDIDITSQGSRGTNYGAKSTYYNLYYEYTVDNKIYTGMIEDQNRSRRIGESLKIKYDPQEPSKSTHILEPSKDFIVIGTVFLILFILTTALAIYLVKKYLSSKTSKERPLE